MLLFFALCPAKVAFTYMLPPVTVTSLRPTEEVPALFETKLLYKDVAHTHPLEFSDILQKILGVQTLPLSTGLGAPSFFSVQGGENRHVLVFVDGMPANDPSDPTGAWNGGPMLGDSFDALTMQKNSLSSVYGPSGLSGTLLLETQQGQEKPRNTLSVSTGSHSLYRTKMHSQGKIQRFSYNINANMTGDQGRRVKPIYLRTAPRDYLTDKAKIFNLRGRFDGECGKNKDITLTWMPRFEQVTKHYNGYQPSSNLFKKGNAHNMQQVFKLTQNIEPFQSNGEQVFSYGLSTKKRKDKEDRAPLLSHNRYKGTVHHAAYTFFLEKNAWSGRGGLNFQRDTLTLNLQNFTAPPQTIFLKKSHDCSAIFLAPKYTWNFLNHHSLAFLSSVRLEHHEGFGKHMSYGLGGMYEAPTNTVISLHYATGFHAPSLYPRFIKTAFTQGNPFLKPEISSGYQGGITQKIKEKTSLNVLYFEKNVRGLIEYKPNAQGIYTPFNQGRALLKGWEVGAAYTQNFTRGFLKLKGGYTHTRTHDPSTGKSLLRRFQHGWNMTFEYEEKDMWDAGIVWQKSQKSYDIDPKTFKTVQGKYLETFKLYGNYHVKKGVTLFFKVDNLLNRTNEFPLGYTQNNRTFLSGLTVTW